MQEESFLCTGPYEGKGFSFKMECFGRETRLNDV
jgi:hypothetical protein